MSELNSGRKIAAVLGAACTLLLIAVVVLSVLAVKWHGQASDAKADTAAGRAALAQAKKDLELMEAYSWKEPGSYDDWADAFTSPEVAQPFRRNLKMTEKVIALSKTVAKGDIVDAAYRVVDAHHVEILAFVDQIIVAHTQNPLTVDQQRVRMTMTTIGGQWKISNFEVVQHSKES
ncbi:hypothetical protein [Nocardioides montaniterrae]